YSRIAGERKATSITINPFSTKILNTMATTEPEILELYRVSLTNAGSQPAIAQILAEYGYGPEKLKQGWALLADVEAASDIRETERNESSAAYHAFQTLWDQLMGIYAAHRRKAKVAFSKDPVLAERIKVHGAISRTYMRWLATVKPFYRISLADPKIQEGLARVRVSMEELNAANAMIPELEAARTFYIKEKGESQNATKIKDEAMGRIDDWMKEFYAIAKIALEESPQLMESLGRLVRS